MLILQTPLDRLVQLLIVHRGVKASTSSPMEETNHILRLLHIRKQVLSREQTLSHDAQIRTRVTKGKGKMRKSGHRHLSLAMLVIRAAVVVETYRGFEILLRSNIDPKVNQCSGVVTI